MSTSPVFHNLWPTTIMSVILPGSDMANPVLTEFINELDDERSNNDRAEKHDQHM